MEIHAYVIMPDHLHLLSNVVSSGHLASTLSSFRSYTAKHLVEMLDARGFEWALRSMRKPSGDFDFWEPSYHPVDASRGAFAQKREYIHLNPVRRGFVEKPEHWQYGSARSFALQLDDPVRVCRDYWG